MNLISKNRADNFFRYHWLCDPILADWIINILSAYGTSILDVGCGNGYMVNFYTKVFGNIAVIEPSDTFAGEIAKLAAKKNFIYKKANAEHIPFSENSFDIVFAKSSLHHFADIPQGLSEMQRVSRQIVAVMEVVAPSQECLPFLQDILVKKEDGRKSSTIYTECSLKTSVSNVLHTEHVNQLFFDQYIDIETWIQYSDLSDAEKSALLDDILSMDSVTANHMHLHKRNDRYAMLRRMCLCIVPVSHLKNI